jgi:hypothetical protein
MGDAVQMIECLELRPSPVHGLGIFAKNNISINQYLGDYIGTPMTKKEFKEKYGNDISYTYWTNHNFKNTLVYCAKEKRNFITFINESKNPNVILKKRKLYSIVALSSGQELFLKYDSTYPRNYVL